MNQNEFTLQLALRLLADPNRRGPVVDEAEELVGSTCPKTGGRASQNWWNEANGRAAYRDAQAVARGVFAEAEKFE